MLMFVSLFRNRAVNKGDITPGVSFIITAFNEEKLIKQKIENTLTQDYPKEKMEIIVASDCSTDRTDEIVNSYRPQGVKLVRAPERRGKENAQKIAVDHALGEILIFSDVATILQKDGVANIVRNFCDPTVGCVSSEDKFIDKDGKISGEGAYVRYEMLLRNLETRINTLVGLSGSFFAARKEVCRNWAIGLQSDFSTVLNSVKAGLRGVSDPDSIGYYRNITDEEKEFKRKVRTVLRGISVFMKSLGFLNPFKYGLFSWQFFSHKLCRWLVPFAMIAALATNLYLAFEPGYYRYAFAFQASLYLLALSGIAAGSTRAFLKIPAFFVLVNVSILTAWYLYCKGENIVTWTPSERQL
jgi:cellulose synthase/poly-beta-1,6-N-acetylglucosamine synthase-like glycosyltransferase